MPRCTSAFLRYLKGPYLRAALASAGMSVDDVPTCRLRARLYGEGCCFLCNYFVIAQLFTIHSQSQDSEIFRLPWSDLFKESSIPQLFWLIVPTLKPST